MNWTVTKILPMRPGQRFKVPYYRLEFRGDDGSWAKTDLVPGFANFPRWRDAMRPGAQLANLRTLDDTTIDADSHPVVVRFVALPTRPKAEPTKADPQMELL